MRSSPISTGFAVLALAALALLAARPALADSLTWNIRSEHPNIVHLEFYSDSGTVWPGGDEVFSLEDSQVQSFPLACDAGEQICYGAWVDGNESVQWGAGRGGGEGCDDCCLVCDGGESPVVVLAE